MLFIKILTFILFSFSVLDGTSASFLKKTKHSKKIIPNDTVKRLDRRSIFGISNEPIKGGKYQGSFLSIYENSFSLFLDFVIDPYSHIIHGYATITDNTPNKPFEIPRQSIEEEKISREQNNRLMESISKLSPKEAWFKGMDFYRNLRDSLDSDRAIYDPIYEKSFSVTGIASNDSIHFNIDTIVYLNKHLIDEERHLRFSGKSMKYSHGNSSEDKRFIIGNFFDSTFQSGPYFGSFLIEEKK
jgi:hypothetical protein